MCNNLVKNQGSPLICSETDNFEVVFQTVTFLFAMQHLCVPFKHPVSHTSHLITMACGLLSGEEDLMI